MDHLDLHFKVSESTSVQFPAISKMDVDHLQSTAISDNRIEMHCRLKPWEEEFCRAILNKWLRAFLTLHLFQERCRARL